VLGVLNRGSMGIVYRSMDPRNRREVAIKAVRRGESPSLPARLRLEAPFVLIAAGTKPSVSPLVPINGRNIVNSDQVLQMPELPRTLIEQLATGLDVPFGCQMKFSLSTQPPANADAT